MRHLTLTALATLSLFGPAFAANGTTAPTTAATTASAIPGPTLIAGQTVNVNTASLADLEKGPGLGVKLATAVMQARPYRNQAELVKKVKGIGKKNIKKLGPFFTY